MRPIDLFPGPSGQLRTPRLLRTVRLLVLTITWATSVTSFAVSFSLGDELVTIGQNFTGLSGAAIPPDTMGAVGPTAFVELINNGYSVYDKSSSTVLQTSTLNQFWNDAGVKGVSFTNPAFDPRVVYDPFNDRYLAASVDNPNRPNNFLLAISKSSDPTLGWNGFAIQSDMTQQRWADFPTLGYNRDGVYLSANMIPVQGDQQANTIVAIPKTDLLAPVPTVAHAAIFPNQIGDTGISVQPIVDLDNKRSSTTLLSSPIPFADQLTRSDLLGDIRSPIRNIASAIIPVSPYPAAFSAVQPGVAPNLDIGFGSQLSSNVVVQNNTMWGVQTVSDSGQAALRWFQIDIDTNKVLQEGLIKKPGLDLFYGSIAVNKSGEMVIGFTGSGKSQFASAYAVAGITINGKTIFTDPFLLQEGVASYRRVRWGDYSATTLDPSNSKSFWTIQEWATGEVTWSTQITEISFGFAAAPEPSTLVLIGSGLLGLARWQRCRKTRQL